MTRIGIFRAILREYLSADSPAIRTAAEAILIQNTPGDADDAATWPGWACLLPHLLALDPAGSTSEGLHDLACDAAWHLIRRGDTRSGHDLARRLYDQWRELLGPDHRHTLMAANVLADALRQTGPYNESRQLDEDNFARHRRLHGADDRLTRASAHNLALDLRFARPPA